MSMRKLATTARKVIFEKAGVAKVTKIAKIVKTQNISPIMYTNKVKTFFGKK